MVIRKNLCFHFRVMTLCYRHSGLVCQHSGDTSSPLHWLNSRSSPHIYGIRPGDIVQLLCDGTGAQTSFCLLVEWTSPCTLAVDYGGDSSVHYWQLMCVSACSVCTSWRGFPLPSCDAYGLLTPLSCFPFTSPPSRRVVPRIVIRLYWRIMFWLVKYDRILLNFFYYYLKF